MIVFGAIVIDGSVWFNPPHSGYGFLATSVVIGSYFIFLGIFDYNPRRIMKGPTLEEFRKSTKLPSENKRNTLSLEEQYYYKGKTNQQLNHYNESLQCYNKSLELNPDFEPSKKAKKEVEKILE